MNKRTKIILGVLAVLVIAAILIWNSGVADELTGKLRGKLPNSNSTQIRNSNSQTSSEGENAEEEEDVPPW